MEELLRIRERHGGTHVVILPDGQVIPCRLLSVNEFLEYEKLSGAGRYPTGYLEDEIFRKCVLDQELVRGMHALRAGVVTQVANAIYDHSGPKTVDELDTALNIKRAEISNIFYDAVSVICQAYPAYSPDDLFKMDFESMWERLAMAERKLLQVGYLQKPLSFNSGQEQAAKQKRPQPVVNNLADAWRKQQEQPPAPKPPPPSKQKPKKQTIITDNDIVEHHAAYTGHEKEDRIILEHQMLQETAGIYQEYIDQMDRGEKVRILTPEERTSKAKDAIKRHRAIRQEMAKKKMKHDQELEAALEAKRLAAKQARKRRKR